MKNQGPVFELATVALLAAGLAVPARAQDAGTTSTAGKDIQEWMLRLPTQPGVITEMLRFREGERNLDRGFAEAQASRLRRAVAESARREFDQVLAGGCTPSVNVTFPKPDEWEVEPTKIEGEFLDGLVRTVTTACFPKNLTPPQEALDLYTSPSFRMEAESRIEKMWEENGYTCIHTGGVPLLLSPTEACNQITRLQRPGLAVEHSQVVRNSTDDGVQPVYFKESLKAFFWTPDGLAFVYVNYSRSVDLGRVSRWVAPGKIRESQESQVETLRGQIGR